MLRKAFDRGRHYGRILLFGATFLKSASLSWICRTFQLGLRLSLIVFHVEFVLEGLLRGRRCTFCLNKLSILVHFRQEVSPSVVEEGHIHDRIRPIFVHFIFVVDHCAIFNLNRIWGGQVCFSQARIIHHNRRVCIRDLLRKIQIIVICALRMHRHALLVKLDVRHVASSYSQIFGSHLRRIRSLVVPILTQGLWGRLFRLLTPTNWISLQIDNLPILLLMLHLVLLASLILNGFDWAGPLRVVETLSHNWTHRTDSILLHGGLTLLEFGGEDVLFEELSHGTLLYTIGSLSTRRYFCTWVSCNSERVGKIAKNDGTSFHLFVPIDNFACHNAKLLFTLRLRVRSHTPFVVRMHINFGNDPLRKRPIVFFDGRNAIRISILLCILHQVYLGRAALIVPPIFHFFHLTLPLLFQEALVAGEFSENQILFSRSLILFD